MTAHYQTPGTVDPRVENNFSPAKLHTILISAIRRYVPADTDIECLEQVGDEPNCADLDVPYAGSLNARVLHIPCPESPQCLFIGLHEVGHFAHKDEGGAQSLLHYRPGQELEASVFARDFMQSYGVPIDTQTWNRAVWFADNAEEVHKNGGTPTVKSLQDFLSALRGEPHPLAAAL